MDIWQQGEKCAIHGAVGAKKYAIHGVYFARVMGKRPHAVTGDD